MTMAQAARGGFLMLFCLLLSGCMAQRRAEAVTSAAPYVAEALTRPMPELYDKAVSGSDAGDELRLGLALAAGRPSPAVPNGADRDSLTEIDARFQTAKRAWLKENPPGSENEVPWAHQIRLTANEGAVIVRSEITASADYWLLRAEGATDFSYISVPFPVGKYGAVSYMTRTVIVPTIDKRVLLTAEACANAVRQSAGLTAPSLPEVVHRLAQDGAGMPIGQAVPNPTKLKPGRDYVIGAAACGAADTFSHYIALLKISRLSDSPHHGAKHEA